ncbi:MAG: hypothetical protein QOI24_4338 [Acidobacteriota bacterium]|jgi:hypothetical protein|nr:hypothetical protein [Acidobacteriota bacterium]
MRCVALLSLLALAAFADDSPLVEASKRARSENAKPHTTITNKDLKKTGGHITTTKKTPKISHSPVAKAAAKVTPPPPPPVPAPAAESDPPDDAEGYSLEEQEALYYYDYGEVIAKIPASIAAKPQFSQPKVAPPTNPPYTKPVAPPVSPTVTPQYTPQTPPPGSH